jgi:hypothetical protein
MFLKALSLAVRGVEIETAMFIIFPFTFPNLLLYQEIKKSCMLLRLWREEERDEWLKTWLWEGEGV